MGPSIVGDPCGENAFPRSQKEAGAGASIIVPEDPINNTGGFESSSEGSAAPAQATPAATSGPPICLGEFKDDVADVFYKRGKYGTLYWDFILAPSAIEHLGPDVVVNMTYADVNGKPINPPYSPHAKESDYDFHSSMRKYQGLAGNPSGTIKTGDRVTLIWVIDSVANPKRFGYRRITCIVSQPGFA